MSVKRFVFSKNDLNNMPAYCCYPYTFSEQVFRRLTQWRCDSGTLFVAGRDVVTI